MEFNNVNSEFDMNILLDEYISKLYIKFKDYNKAPREDIFKFMVRKLNAKEINIFSLYSLYIMDTIDDDFKKDVFFDQEIGCVPPKSKHQEGNEYISNNEIHAVLEELEIKPKNDIISKHIMTRIRFLSIMDIWNNNIDCETLIFNGKETERFKEEFKKYIFGNSKYLRYSRLLKAALDNAKIFEHPDVLPSNFKELKQFLKNPLIYVMLEPYNHMNKEKDIVTGYISEGEVVIHKL